MSSRELLLATAEEGVNTPTDRKQLFLFSARVGQTTAIPLLLPEESGISSYGGTTISTTSPKFDTYCIVNSYGQPNASSQLSIALGASGLTQMTNMLLTNGPDCTVECWLRKPTSWLQYEQIFGNWESQNSASNGAFQFALINGKIFAQFGGANIQGNTIVASTGVWSHIAWARTSGLWKVYYNGVSDATAKTLNTISGLKTNVGFLKTESTQTYGFTGSIDEFRIVVGTAIYTGNFTPPTARFPSTRYI